SDLVHWGGHQPLYGGKEEWESGRVGAGPPPLKIEEGWLALYHGNRRPSRPGDVGCYQGAALILDAEDPTRVIKRTRTPLMSPTEQFEQHGFVAGVVFPTGLVQRGDRVLAYCGASDATTAVAQASLSEIIEKCDWVSD